MGARVVSLWVGVRGLEQRARYGSPRRGASTGVYAQGHMHRGICTGAYARGCIHGGTCIAHLEEDEQVLHADEDVEPPHGDLLHAHRADLAVQRVVEQRRLVAQPLVQVRLRKARGGGRGEGASRWGVVGPRGEVQGTQWRPGAT